MYSFAIASEISLHRYFTHQVFTTHRLKELILHVIGGLIGQGSVISWVTIHRNHHAYEDTEKDPHSPFHMPWYKIYLGFLKPPVNKNAAFNLLKNKNRQRYLFENKYYLLMWVALWVCLYLVSLEFLLFVVSGSTLWYAGTCSINILAHRYVGKKDYPESVGLNSRILNALTLVGYHNNHHKNPRSESYTERDFIGILIKLFFKQKI